MLYGRILASSSCRFTVGYGDVGLNHIIWFDNKINGGNKMQATYRDAGVDTTGEEVALAGLLNYVRRSHALRRHGSGALKLDIGYFANVIEIGDRGLAISTDGVGTKILIAQMMNKYDTVGIDCVAMNVNDIICVGAEPLSMLDYIAVCSPNAELLADIGKGLLKGAELARITIAGGEIAQVRDMLKGVRPNYEFDLVGTAIGEVALDRIITGEDIGEHDAIIGLRSNGIHSNGLSLARHILAQQPDMIDTHFPELGGRTLGEELLVPTRIYVAEIMDMLNANLDIKALVHITSGGLLNLSRVQSTVGFVIEDLPDTPPIFSLLQQLGNIPKEEMYRVYNMGIGFCVVVPEREADAVIDIASRHGVDAYMIGHTMIDRSKRVIIKPENLCSKADGFVRC